MSALFPPQVRSTPARAAAGLLRKCLPLLSLVGLAISLGGCGRGGKSIPGIERFHLGVVEDRLFVSLVASTLHLDQGLSFPVPGLPDSQLAFGPDLQSEGTLIQFSTALSSEDGVGVLPPATLAGLPDGRPLPDIRGGALPRRTFTVGPVELSLYLSEETWGLFLPLSLRNPSGLRLFSTLSLPILDEFGNVLGRAYAIPKSAFVSSSVSGILILVPFVRPVRTP